MIPLINQYSQWGRSEVVIIYPDSMLFGGWYIHVQIQLPPKYPKISMTTVPWVVGGWKMLEVHHVPTKDRSVSGANC